MATGWIIFLIISYAVVLSVVLLFLKGAYKDE